MCNGRVTLGVAWDHVAKDVFPACVTSSLSEFFAIDDETLESCKLLRIFKSCEKVIVLFVVLKKVSREHVMACRHRALMRPVRRAVRAGLRPCHAVRVIEKTDHPMHEVVGAGDLLVGSDHHLILTVESFG